MNPVKNKLAVGTLFLMIAQFSVAFTGYFIHIILGRMLGPALYGDFGIINSLMLINTALFLTGTSRAVSKYIAEDENQAGIISLAGIKFQLILSAGCVLFYLLFSSTIAILFKDVTLRPLIFLASFVVITQGMYTIIVKGYLNGVRDFKRQAIIEIALSFSRVIVALVLLYFGFGVGGVVTAYVITPLIILLFIPELMKSIKSRSSFNLSNLASYVFPITLSLAIFVIGMESGILFIKVLLPDDSFTGLYTAAATFPKMLYSLFIALSFSILPAISSAFAAKNKVLLHKYIYQSTRYSIMILVPAAALMSVYASNLIDLFYAAPYSGAGPVLEVLIFSSIFYSLFLTMNSIISVTDKPGSTIFLSSIFMLTAFIFNFLFIPRFSLFGAALAAVLSGFVGVLVSSIYLYRRLGALFPFKSFVKVLVAALTMYLGAAWIDVSGWLFIPAAVGWLLLYLLLLYLFGELNVEDLRLLFSMLRRPLSTLSTKK